MRRFNGTGVSWIRLAFFGCLLATAMAGALRLRAQETSNASAERMLLLQSGKIVKGVVRQSAAGYTVNVTGGQLVLPFDQVRLEGADLEDIYRQQRDTLPEHTAAAHIELARWCLTNGLPDPARKELRHAVKLEPDSTIAKNMLQRINEQLLTTKETPALGRRDGEFSFLGNAKPGVAPEMLGGLPRETASDFMLKVQPLLVNRCATAGCHGPGSGSSFELVRAKLGKAPPKSYSERNLAAVLERVDRERPLSSPLLTKLRGESKAIGGRQSHGGLSPEQQQTLRAWIESMSKKPESVPKPKVEVVDDDSDMPAEDEKPAVSDSAKSINDLRDKQRRDDELADENLFRRLLRELRDDTPKPATATRSTSDE